MACLTFSTAIIAFFLVVLLVQLTTTSDATKVSHDGRAITIDGQRRLLISGSIHYPRSTLSNN
ncbi:hypothetical protein OSB04_031547 [Centaurea solstitialis]|uniref:Beta-galactosidase n=1 Tax=Centaurea solstitialis TaxID=347529 RepID=A0AA38S967_9ASTR|nr:hypothetical protein OSB04_031547 [Centaurea solstitialis]